MSDTLDPATKQERGLRIILRLLGTAAGLAVFAVVMPRAWMDGIHQWLGLGKLPEAPIVGYLARSTSAFYALLGGLLWVISFDLRRHRAVLCYLGVAVMVFGLTIYVVDWLEGLPGFWTFWEGPIDFLYGLAILWLGSRRRTTEPS